MSANTPQSYAAPVARAYSTHENLTPTPAP